MTLNNMQYERRFVTGQLLRWDRARIFAADHSQVARLPNLEDCLRILQNYPADMWNLTGTDQPATFSPEGEHSGGSVNYYKVFIEHPDSEGVEPYQAECTDIIEALGMTFAEANIFKEIWRTSAARTLGKKKAGHDALYGAEKIEYYAARNMRKVKRTQDK